MKDMEKKHIYDKDSAEKLKQSNEVEKIDPY